MKRGRKKGGSKEKVFGCDLMDHLTATTQEIPQVLRSCSMFIEEHGIVDGIYRLSGVSSNTQKLRSEFDNEGSPDLYKDVYLQDIHCVSSLCKAYFRELPNPLLTYQLYDHFAEAVAVQLEEERLVKIKDVLKELPVPHHRTLEYLMKHLVRMATYSNLTNMHARNLAIVWAPNLLRSKDIEASGFNGTAAFMEVRVQSIVVEFILTHVSQLFPETDPEPGPTSERRKSLPSPSILSSQEEPFFKALPYQRTGNMSPGDGPPAMRSYHAIIDGTEKRKGSLKGRKWTSIFNLGGRLHDPRKKKYAPKEKEKTALRPAKSMDSLSSGPYTQEDSRHTPPNMSPLAMTYGTAEGGSNSGGGVASGYAVTYRRTGGASVSMVSGTSGAQGTYRSLDPLAGANADKSQSPSQATPSRAERRAGVHISGPFSVTVPLHITSGLALGVLQGGKAEEEEPKQGQNDETQLKKDKRENDDGKEHGNAPTDRKTESLKENKNKSDDDVSDNVGVEKGKREDDEPEEARFVEEEKSEDKGEEDECLSNERQHATDRPSVSGDMDGEGYMVMKGGLIQCETDGHQNESLNMPPEEENPDDELPLDFQDTFGFLDLMDMTTSNQINEFSVEPPASDVDEYEEENNVSPSSSHSHMEMSQLDLPPHTGRPLSNKSYSLPYKSYPFQPDLSFSSDEDCYSGPSDVDDDDDDSSDLDKADYEDMFFKSLPSDYQFQQLKLASCSNVTFDSDTNVDSQSKNQSECINTTQAIPEDIQDCPPADRSADVALIDVVTITSNAEDHCLNVEDLSTRLSETKQLSMEMKETEDRSSEDDGKDRNDSAELGDGNEAIEKENKEMESTDGIDETVTCSHIDGHSSEEENQEDTYYDPDTPSTTMELSDSETVETSCRTDPVINQEPAQRPEDLTERTESVVGIAESETMLDATSPELQSQNKPETVELSVQAEIDLQANMQGEIDVNELEVVVASEERDVDWEGEEDREARETDEEAIRMGESTESDGEKNDQELVDEDTIVNESDTVPKEEQTNLENEKDDEKEKDGSDKGEAGDQKMEEEYDVEKEIKTQKGCHYEGITELKEGSVPEELDEKEDSEDGEERRRGKEKDSMREDKHEDPSISDSEKPVRRQRKKEREEGERTGLGLGLGRTVIISKHKVYQVKAVPVVPPKPQHSKITAFRQQFQQRDTERQQQHTQPTYTERQHSDRRVSKKEHEKEENRHAEIGDVAQNHDYQSTEQEKGSGTDGEREEVKDTKTCLSLEDEVDQDTEEQTQRRGTWDGGSLRKDAQNELDREARRTSGISMCFDEAVARATGKRYREKESIEKEKLVDLQ